MVQISDSDIQAVEKVLLPEGCTFNDERVDFIRCMESKDVVACPGSGKTTALLAKLLILASKIPFPDSRGICVITHTNRAIDIIKAKLEGDAEYLFKSPNFFGTIQTFVNTFLAIPAYIERFSTRHIIMDQDIYEKKAWGVFCEQDLEKNGVIYSQLKNKINGKTWSEQRRLKFDFFVNMDFCFEDNYVSYKRGDSKKIILNGSKGSKSYPPIHEAKYSLLKDGYLRFSDSFSLAKWYTNKWPIIQDAMKERFAFVLIDEAQDTDRIQFEILDSLFDSSKIIVQYLGDPNQAIFGSRVKKDMVWKPIENPIHFSDTKRFGKTITELLHTVRVDDQISLKENPDQNSLPLHIITYTDRNIKNVLPAFARLIQSNSLHKDHAIKRSTFKAIGWIGKDKTEEGKLCLRYYFPNYRKSIKTRKEYFSNLLSYLSLASNRELKTKGAKVYKDAILQGIVHAFYLGGLKNPENDRRFTSNSFSKWFRENDEPAYLLFIARLSKWIILLHRREQTPIQIRDEVAVTIRKEKDIQITNELKNFLTSDTLEFSEEEQRTSNTFTSDDGISIEVGTVHSVKGETHTATLYLETYYQSKTDSQRLLEFLKGNYPQKELAKSYHIENLKIAHVAFSRPTHLLAFACHKDSINSSKADLENNGWNIKSVEDLLKSCE